jgi:hypothetical protein
MNIKINILSRLSKHLKHFLMLGALLPGILTAALVNPAMAMDAECAHKLMEVETGMQDGMPADPEVAQKALDLRREGSQLCHDNAGNKGQAKLQEAATVLETGELQSPAATTLGVKP